MSQEKKGGFFSFFKKSTPAATPPVVSAPAPATRPEISVSPLSAEKPKPAAVPTPSPFNEPASEGGIDTVASFTLLCQALVDINRSQLKVVELIVTTLSGSVTKLAESFNQKS